MACRSFVSDGRMSLARLGWPRYPWDARTAAYPSLLVKNPTNEVSGI